MLRPMLTATALALVLSAPALAQQQVEPEAAPAEPQEMPATDQAPAEAQGGQGQAAQEPADTEQAAEEQPAEQQAAAAPGDVFIPSQEEGHLLATELMEVNVVAADGEDIGGIDDLILDPEGGIFGAVVSVGGFLGIGAKEVAVSWSEFKYSPQEQAAHLNVTRADLEQAPDFMTLAEIRAEEEAAAAQQQMQQQGGGGGMAPAAPSQ